MYVMIGVALLLLAAVTYYYLFKIGRHFDRAAFERRNSAGLEEFSTYDESEKTRMKEAGARALMTLLTFVVFIPSLLGGIGFLFVGLTAN
jgi:dolichol kinase